MNFRALGEPEHRLDLSVGRALFLVVHEIPDDVSHRATPLVHQLFRIVRPVEGQTVLHAEAVSAVWPEDLRPQGVRSVVDGLDDLFGALCETQGDQGAVEEARLAARDDVELVVGQLQGAVDADGYGKRSFFRPLEMEKIFIKKKIVLIFGLYIQSD